jgi:hypothetical protein
VIPDNCLKFICYLVLPQSFLAIDEILTHKKMNNMKIGSFPLIILTLTLTSCNNPGRSGKNRSGLLPYHLEIEKNIGNVKSLPLSSIGKKLEYIPLETNPESLLARATKIAFTSSYIFISDGKKLVQFDRKGKFVRNIGSQGRGPHEYLQLCDFLVTESKGLILILDARELLVFDVEGKFIESSPLPFNSFNIVSADDGNLIYYCINDPRNKDNISSWFVTDIHGKNLRKYKNYHSRKNSVLGIGSSPLYIYNGTAHFMEFGCDTLLFLAGSSQTPYALFNMGKYKMDPDPLLPPKNMREAMSKFEDKLWACMINEDFANIYIVFCHGLLTERSHCIFDKKSSEVVFITDNSFANDFDGGPAFWPKYIYKDNMLVDAVDAITLLKKINEMKASLSGKDSNIPPEQLELLGKQLTENSNPVLMVLSQ